MRQEPGIRRPFRRKRGMRRRDFLRYTALIGVSAASLNAVIDGYGDPLPATKKIRVTSRCVGCTGCAVICPTAAIEIVPGSIRVDNDLCVSCGYCQTSCAVDGIRVLQPTAVV